MSRSLYTYLRKRKTLLISNNNNNTTVLERVQEIGSAVYIERIIYPARGVFDLLPWHSFHYRYIHLHHNARHLSDIGFWNDFYYRISLARRFFTGPLCYLLSLEGLRRGRSRRVDRPPQIVRCCAHSFSTWISLINNNNVSVASGSCK